MKALPTILNIVVPQGTTYPVRLRWQNCVYATKVVDGVIVNALTGAPVPAGDLVAEDLAGCVIRGAMRKKHADPVPQISFSAAGNNVFLDPATQIFGIDFLPLDTSPLKATDREYETSDDGRVILRASDYFYDIEVVSPSGDVTRAVHGVVTLVAEVSK